MPANLYVSESFFGIDTETYENWSKPTSTTLTVEMIEKAYEKTLGINSIRRGIRFKDKIWTTRDGRDLLISTMTTDHITNCLNMLIKNNKFRQNGKCFALFNELVSRRIKKEYKS